MNKEEFRKLSNCLELLALKEIISNKKQLLKYEYFQYLNKEETEQFIEIAEKDKDLVKNKIKDRFGLNYNSAIKYAKENQEKYIELYNLNYMSYYDNIFYYIKHQQEKYLDLVENFLKKEAKKIIEELVGE